MSLESLIEESGQQATITSEAPAGQLPPQTLLGGVDRSDPNWVTVAAGVPCLVNVKSSTLSAFPSRNDARANVADARIYFLPEAIALGITTRMRITVIAAPPHDPVVLGVYSVQGMTDPNSMGRILQIDCERVRNP